MTYYPLMITLPTSKEYFRLFQYFREHFTPSSSFYGTVKKRNIYIGTFFLFSLLFCFEIQRLIDSYLNHISLWVFPPFLLVFKRTELPGFIASLYAYGLHKAAMPKPSNLLG